MRSYLFTQATRIPHFFKSSLALIPCRHFFAGASKKQTLSGRTFKLCCTQQMRSLARAHELRSTQPPGEQALLHAARAVKGPWTNDPRTQALPVASQLVEHASYRQNPNSQREFDKKIYTLKSHLIELKKVVQSFRNYNEWQQKTEKARMFANEGRAAYNLAEHLADKASRAEANTGRNATTTNAEKTATLKAEAEEAAQRWKEAEQKQQEAVREEKKAFEKIVHHQHDWSQMFTFIKVGDCEYLVTARFENGRQTHDVCDKCSAYEFDKLATRLDPYEHDYEDKYEQLQLQTQQKNEERTWNRLCLTYVLNTMAWEEAAHEVASDTLITRPSITSETCTLHKHVHRHQNVLYIENLNNLAILYGAYVLLGQQRFTDEHHSVHPKHSWCIKYMKELTNYDSSKVPMLDVCIDILSVHITNEFFDELDDINGVNDEAKMVDFEEILIHFMNSGGLNGKSISTFTSSNGR